MLEMTNIGKLQYTNYIINQFCYIYEVMTMPQIIIVKKTAKKRYPRRYKRERSPESWKRKHEIHRKKRKMRGGFPPTHKIGKDL